MTFLRKNFFIFCASLVAIILLVVSYQTQQRMNVIREAERLVDADIVENAPPMVAFTTVALGSFRGIIANFLWLRSNRMQEQGRYFEMVQLASWITMLQPRFTGATAYLAWNMAYNISVTFTRPEDRWRWVQRGIELIRDEALVYNPGDPELYRELGWIYQHKLGQEMDDANIYYKWQLAEQMMEVLGTYPVDWQKWADAPATEAGLRQLLGAEHPIWQWLERQELTLDALEQQFREHKGFTRELNNEMRRIGARETLNIYFRGRWLRQQKKLQPHRIAAINRRYGELDWRLPEAHAIYWATRGLEVAEGELHLSCQRMIFQSLNNAFAGGKLLYYQGETETRERPVVQFIPNIEIVDAVDQAYREAIELYPDNVSMSAARRHFLVRATSTLYTFGREDKAREYLGKLRRDYPDRQYRQPLEDFVLQHLAGDIPSMNFNQAQSVVQGYLVQMCYNLALGQYERAAAMEAIARGIWDRYMDRIGEVTEARRGLPPYETMRRNVISQALDTYNPEFSGRLRAALREMGFTSEAGSEAGSEQEDDW